MNENVHDSFHDLRNITVWFRPAKHHAKINEMEMSTLIDYAKAHLGVTLNYWRTGWRSFDELIKEYDHPMKLAYSDEALFE